MTQIKLDIFPAILSIAPPGLLENQRDNRAIPPLEGTRQVNTVRVIVTANPARVLVARDSAQGPEIIFAEGYDPSTLDTSTFSRKEATPGTEAFLTTTSGKELAFLKDSSCGCGSRLKSWNPFRSLTA